MAQPCPQCRTMVDDDLLCCPACRAPLDPGRTILPPGPKSPMSSRSSVSNHDNSARGQDETPNAGNREQANEEVPRVKSSSSGKKQVRPKTYKPSNQAPRPAQQMAPQPHAVPPPPPQPPVHDPGYGNQYPQQVQPGGQASQGGVRGWMIKMLGGAPANPYPAPPQHAQGITPQPPSSPYPQPGSPPPQPHQNPGFPNYQNQNPQQSPFAVPQYSSGSPSPSWPPQQNVPSPPPNAEFGFQSPGSDEYDRFPHRNIPPYLDPAGAGDAGMGIGANDGADGRTVVFQGVNVDKLKIPKHKYTLQILDGRGQWRDLGPIQVNGLHFGRSKNSSDLPGLNTLAVHHMKFRYERTSLVIEDMGSINGVYLRVLKPTELMDGMRFRLGNQIFEFHEVGPVEPSTPLVSDDGEEFCGRDFEPLAYLDLIRADGKPGLRFPITRQDPTVIGRDGPNTHLALPTDGAISGMHARIYRKEGTFYLEDLKSRNGTFIHVLGSAKIGSGDVILAGRVLFRVLDQLGG